VLQRDLDDYLKKDVKFACQYISLIGLDFSDDFAQEDLWVDK
jgi:hypothetical protein